MCLQWHRSGEHQLHFHGSRKHRNSQGISQLNSVWELKEELISSAQLLFLSLPEWLTEIPGLVSAASLFQRTANIYVEYSVTCLCAMEGGNSDLSELDTETIICRTKHSLSCVLCLCFSR